MVSKVIMFYYSQPAQIKRMNKTQVEGRRAQIRLSARQVAKNVSYTGGFIGMLASLGVRALLTILAGLATGPLSGGISKAICGDRLFLHKHGKYHSEFNLVLFGRHVANTKNGDSWRGNV